MQRADLMTPDFGTAPPDRSSWLSALFTDLDTGGPVDRPFAPFPAATEFRSIFEHFVDVATRTPDRIAVDDGQIRLTYRGLLAAARAVARQLSDPVRPGLVATLLPNSTLSIPAILGCLAAGRPILPRDLRYPTDHNLAVLADAAPAFLLTTTDIRHQLGLDNMTVLLIDETVAKVERGAVGEPPLDPEPPLGLDEPAFVLYTSGSKGEPKGIVNSQRALLQRVSQHVNAGHLGPDDRFMPLSSACTIAGLREILTSLLCGATLYMTDPRRLSLRELRTLIDTTGVTVMYVVPSLIRSILADKRSSGASDSLASLRLVRVGGDRVMWSDIAELHWGLPEPCLVQVGFSSTETTGTQWFVPRSAAPGDGAVPLGRVLPGIGYRIETEDGAEAAQDEPGELVVCSPFVALGTWRAGVCVPGAVMPDPTDPSRRIFRTGDMVWLGPDGLLHTAGRQDRQVKVRGQRVEPAELESALRRAASVADAAVAGRRLANDAVLIGFVVLHPDVVAEEAVATLRTQLRASLPPALQPAAIHVLDALPLLPSMKVDAKALVAHDLASMTETLSADDVALSDQAVVGQAWNGLFGPRSLARDESWQDAGGDSLQTLMFISELERSLGLTLALDLFDETMRPSDVVALIGRLKQTAVPAEQQMGEQELRGTLLFAPGIGGDEPLVVPLRRELSQNAHVLTLRYTPWAVMREPGWSFEKLIDLAVQTLEGRPDNRVSLVGYSFGGIVAYAVACRLAAMGYEVGPLVLLDTGRDRLTAGPPRRPVAQVALYKLAVWLRLRPPNADPRIWDYLADALLHPALGAILQRLLPDRRSPALNRSLFSLDQAIDRAMRLKAGQEWLQRVQAPTDAFQVILLRSEEHAPDAPRDLGWRSLASRLRIVDSLGTHRTMLVPPNHLALAGIINAGTAGKEPAVRPSETSRAVAGLEV